MSNIKRCESVETTVMEPHISGKDLVYRETEVTKHAFQCLGCGLVWAIAWHAETCESRGHIATWQQMYCQGIENGKPINPRYFPRYALRHDPIVEDAAPVKEAEIACNTRLVSNQYVDYVEIESPSGRTIRVPAQSLKGQLRWLATRRNAESWRTVPLTKTEMKELLALAS